MARQARRRPYVYDYPRPMVTVDLVVLTVLDGRLRVLLIRRGRSPFKGSWALPGGFVDMNESLADAARRELAEETGLRLPRSNAWLGQLEASGRPGRDPRGRVITVAYLALIRPGRAPDIAAGGDAAAAVWFNAYRLPKLAFDHREIIRCALARLRNDLPHGDLVFRLLPARFLFDELQHVHEMVLRRPLDKRSFRRGIRARGVLRPTTERRRDQTGHFAQLYRY